MLVVLIFLTKFQCQSIYLFQVKLGRSLSLIKHITHHTEVLCILKRLIKSINIYHKPAYFVTEAKIKPKEFVLLNLSIYDDNLIFIYLDNILNYKYITYVYILSKESV